MSENDIVLFWLLTAIPLGGLVALAWMHWYSRDARKLLREVEEMERQEREARLAGRMTSAE